MSKYSQLLTTINTLIRENENEEITGTVLNSVLRSIVTVMGDYATFAGVAVPATNPGTPAGAVFYLASEPGIYTNFGGIEVTSDELAVLQWDADGNWTVDRIDVIGDALHDISEATESALHDISDAADTAVTTITEQISGLFDDGDDNSDFLISDSNNYAVAQFADGHIKTKFFDSADIPTMKSDIEAMKEAVEEAEITFGLEDVDRIVFFGDSFIHSYYAIPGKDAMARTSLISDWNFESYSTAGAKFYTLLADLFNNVNKFGGNPRSVRNQYAVLCCLANDMKQLTNQQYLYNLEAFVTGLMGCGFTPIISTPYTEKGRDTNVKNVYRHIADKYNLMYWDIAQFATPMRGARDYTAFWHGTHTGTRTNALLADGYMGFVNKVLNRPQKSIKIFRKRDSVTVNTLDDLRYNGIWQRGKLFREIYTGAKSLKAAKYTYVDKIDVVSSSADVTDTRSEYIKMQDGLTVSFNGYALVSAILPVIAAEATKVGLSARFNTSVDVYAFSTPQAPFYQSGSLIEFEATSVVTLPNTGAVYTCNTISGVNFTVLSASDEGDYYSIVTSPSSSVSTLPSGESILTRVSGSGDTTISVMSIQRYDDSASVQFSAENHVGHWVQLTQDDDGYYYVPDTADYVQVDKVDFLVVGSGAFTMTSPSIKVGGAIKKAPQPNPVPSFSHYGNEILSNTTFGSAGVADSNWHDSNNTSIIPISVLDNVYPYGCSSAAYISNTADISFTFTNNLGGARYDKELVLEIVARYFPDIADPDNYNASTHNYITLDSFDYNELKVDIYATDNGSGMKDVTTRESENALKMTNVEYVGTHWKAVRIPVRVAFYNTEIKFRIYSTTAGLQIASISLRPNNNF